MSYRTRPSIPTDRSRARVISAICLVCSGPVASLGGVTAKIKNSPLRSAMRSCSSTRGTVANSRCLGRRRARLVRPTVEVDVEQRAADPGLHIGGAELRSRLTILDVLGVEHGLSASQVRGHVAARARARILIAVALLVDHPVKRASVDPGVGGVVLLED